MIGAIESKTAFKNSYVDGNDRPLEILSYTKHINILIGENNSGKSRFLRTIIKGKDIKVLSNDIDQRYTHSINSARLSLANSVDQLIKNGIAMKKATDHDSFSATELYSYYKDQLNQIDVDKCKRQYPFNNYINDIEASLEQLNQITGANSGKGFSSIPKVYIPILRGIESFDLYFNIRRSQHLDSISMTAIQRDALIEYKQNAKKLYKNKINTVYGIDENIIFTGEDLYNEILNNLLGAENKRNLVRDFERFISKNFYNGANFSIIPRKDKGYLDVKIGNCEEHALHDFGDGIKQLICILYKVFELRDQEALFFIEEPEINLHPAYQRKLIEILQYDEFSKIQFFITTHSNHLVDSCLDYSNISIYKFINIDRQNNLFQVIHTTPKDIELLNLLGVNNSSVFMANSTIWVEGLSDKIYISKYLEVYMKAENREIYKEDVDYSFVEYGGNNITHWNFQDENTKETINASGITNRAMIVLDNDNDSKQRRKEKIKAVFGDRYCELSVREIENTIKKETLERTLFANGPVKYAKGKENSKASLANKTARIWTFIDDHYDTGKKYWNGELSRPTEAKISFAKKVTENINTVDDLSESALALCEQIYGFISKKIKG